MASTKNNLKILEEQIVQGIYLQRHTLLLGLKIRKSAVYFSSASYVCLSRIIKTKTVVHNPGPQGYPLLSTNVGVLPLLIIASLRINQIYKKIDKVKIKPYLHQNNSRS